MLCVKCHEQRFGVARKPIDSMPGIIALLLLMFFRIGQGYDRWVGTGPRQAFPCHLNGFRHEIRFEEQNVWQQRIGATGSTLALLERRDHQNDSAVLYCGTCEQYRSTTATAYRSTST
jgi:hypothetical protein